MENTKDSIYKIITSGGTGTGFKIEGYEYVITNYHVVEGSKQVTVEDHNKDKYIADVIMVNPEVDIAFLDAQGLVEKSSSIKLDQAGVVENLQKVYINGFPFGMHFTVTEGIVSSPNQPMNGRYYIQTDAAVNPGNSGGPMLDAQGNLIAITTSKFTDADNVGFGIKSSDLIKELEDYRFSEPHYRVKCNSCDAYIEQESDYCSNCGSDINSSVYEEFELSYVATFIEEALTQAQINPILCRAGKNYWSFHQEQALVRIFMRSEDFLFAASPLNKLAKTNLTALYRYLCSNPAPPYMLGIIENEIYLSYRVHTSDIYGEKKAEIAENFRQFPQKAAWMQQLLTKNYLCEPSIESKI